MRISKLVSLFLFISISFDAYAYLDPGMGSLLVQGLVGFFAVLSMKVRLVVGYIKHFWLKIKGKR